MDRFAYAILFCLFVLFWLFFDSFSFDISIFIRTPWHIFFKFLYKHHVFQVIQNYYNDSPATWIGRLEQKWNLKHDGIQSSVIVEEQNEQTMEIPD